MDFCNYYYGLIFFSSLCPKNQREKNREQRRTPQIFQPNNSFEHKIKFICRNVHNDDDLFNFRVKSNRPYRQERRQKQQNKIQMKKKTKRKKKSASKTHQL